MKRLLIITVVLAMIALCACGQAQSVSESAPPQSVSESAPPQSEAAPSAESTDLSAMSGSELAAAMKPALDAYASVVNETFGVEYSMEDSRIRLFESEDAAISSDLKDIKAMIPASELSDEGGRQKGGEYDGLAIDPSYGDCYPVSSFGSIAELKAYLDRWLDETVYAQALDGNFIEYDGALYLVRGGRGYGAESIKPDTIAFKDGGDGVWHLAVEGYLFEELSSVVTLTVQQDEGGALRITEAVWEDVAVG